MPIWLAIAHKDLRLLSRDRMALFWVLGFPLLFAAFFGSIMRAAVSNETAPMPVAVVPAAGIARADRLATGLGQAGLRVLRLDMGAAHEAVRAGEAVAWIAPGPLRNDGVALGIDPSRRAEVAMLEGLLMQTLAPEFVSMSSPPPRIETRSVLASQSGRPRSGYELVFPAMILWALLGCAATFAVALVSERSSGTLQRLWAAPIERRSVLLGKATACVLACLGACAALSVAGVVLLGVRIDDPAKYTVATAAAAVCFSGLTMVLGVLGKTEQAVAGAGWSTLIVLAMVGGAMVPLSLMPEWLLSASDASPVKWGIRALEGATFRGDDWQAIARPVSALCALGAAAFAAGASVLSLRET